MQDGVDERGGSLGPPASVLGCIICSMGFDRKRGRGGATGGDDGGSGDGGRPGLISHDDLGDDGTTAALAASISLSTACDCDSDIMGVWCARWRGASPASKQVSEPVALQRGWH